MFPEFDTLEELLAWIKANAKEENGKIIIPAVVELQGEIKKAREGKEKLVEDRKKASARRDELEKKLAEIEPQLNEYKSQVESLQKDGSTDERLKKLAAEKSEVEKELRKAKSTVASFDEKEKQLAEFQAAIKDYETKDRNAKIFSTILKEAKALEIPPEIIDYDLERYVPDFDISEDGEIVHKSDPQKTVKTALSEIQSKRDTWKPTSQGAGSNPGKTPGTGGTQLGIGQLFTSNK